MARGHGLVGAEWRARWKASTKTGSPLFEGPTVDWNINQVALVFWSNFYDNIFEHPERPEQRIIENDDLLDRWVEQKGKEMEERAKKNARKDKYGPSSAYDHDEVILFDEAAEEEFGGEYEEDYGDEEYVEEESY
jgi:hypothetical protein